MSSTKAIHSFEVDGTSYDYFSLKAALAASELGRPEDFPASICILLENLLRANGGAFEAATVAALRAWQTDGKGQLSVPFCPSRVLLQDYTGIPVLVDLAALRQEGEERGFSVDEFNCKLQTDLVVDHSLSVDESGTGTAASRNALIELDRNAERFAFLKWAASSFTRLRVFPPQSGICHQINMEYLASVVRVEPAAEGASPVVSPDTVLGADSHTTTINGLGVLGWGVGGIEALVAVLGNPVVMALPEVIGVRLINALAGPVTATDLVLSLTERFRGLNLVGRFIEFFGPGLSSLSATDRATVANMAPEAGATCAFFPVDSETLRYLQVTSRGASHVKLVETYAKLQGLWRDAAIPAPRFTNVIEFDLGAVEPCVAGPNRPEERLSLNQVAEASRSTIRAASTGPAANSSVKPADVVIAAITSCTNTANPHSVFAAALLARNAVRAGLASKPWVKTSFAPGSRVVREYLIRSGLQQYLDSLGFAIVGFGCTTCIGNAGPLLPDVARELDAQPQMVSAVLSGNRNFAHRVHAQVPMNFLASPALVVAYAIAGSTNVDLTSEPLGVDGGGAPVYLRDLWPSRAEVEGEVHASVGADLFHTAYRALGAMSELEGANVASHARHPWALAPSYVARPPIYHRGAGVGGLRAARILAMYGDGVTTDQISPASPIRPQSLAGRYLIESGVDPSRLHTFGARRGNWEVMLQGAFTNPSLRNVLLAEPAAGMTLHLPSREVLPIQVAATRYQTGGVPLVIVAGRSYGTGSSRDDAAKSTRYLGVSAVIAESFERIHRSNLVALGVLPLTFPPGINRITLGLTGEETIDIDIAPLLAPGAILPFRVSGLPGTIPLRCCIETEDELSYWRAGGILAFLLDRVPQQQLSGERTRT
ncbi:MAG: aconitate hydratase AcnA [Casimicrobiaceae bacterium]